MMATQNSNVMLTLSQLLTTISLSETIRDIPIAGITIDSREISNNYLFVAVKGVHFHGKDFVAQAIANGAVAILMDSEESLSVYSSSVPIIKIDNMEEQLSQIAGNFYGQASHTVPVIGITGTNGKTTCSQLLAQSVALLGSPCGVMGTLGYGIISQKKLDDDSSLPIALTETGMTTTDPVSTQKICAALVEQGANTIVMEVSSHGLSQCRVADIFIRTAVFTNLTHDHLDYHGSMAEYGAAKATLFAMTSVSSAVINLDDPFSATLIQQLHSDVQLVTYSLGNIPELGFQLERNAHFSVKSAIVNEGGTEAILLTPQGEYAIKTSLVGQFNISNLLAVIASLYVNRYSMDSIVAVLPLLTSVPGRMDVIPNQLGVQVVIDYAHTPDALKNALLALRPHLLGALWCVFGCGGDRDREKRPQMAAIAESLADQVIVTSDNPRTESSAQIFAEIEVGFSSPRKVITDRAKAIEFAVSHAKRGDIILIAGKGHENYQIIGESRLPFSDHNEARLGLRRREQGIIL